MRMTLVNNASVEFFIGVLMSSFCGVVIAVEPLPRKGGRQPCPWPVAIIAEDWLAIGKEWMRISPWSGGAAPVVLSPPWCDRWVA